MNAKVYIYIQVTMCKIDREGLTRYMNECPYISFLDVFPPFPSVHWIGADCSPVGILVYAMVYHGLPL